MQEKIILFSIGSVQDFIINSRKVCDLFSGSRILSSLITKGINFVNRFNGQLILPQVLNNKENIPNYFIMLYKNGDFIGKKLEKYVRNQYEEMIKKMVIYKKLKKYEKQIRQQLDSSLDIYWVELELDKDFDINNPIIYKKIYDELYENLEAIKNIKKFQPICEEGKKCSICGIRNSIISNVENDYKMQRYYTYRFMNKELQENSLFKLVDKIEKETKSRLSIDEIKRIKISGKDNYFKYKNSMLKEKEGLCSVCLLKRLYNEKGNMLSTARVALGKWIEENIKSDELAYDDYKNLIENKCKDKGLDLYQCMYKENWNDFLKDEIKKEEYIKELEEHFRKIKNQKLPKYYCVYRMDIDNLGKWMSGKYKKNNNENLYLYQKKLSKNIASFFDKVKQYFNSSYNGILIYAGGDDMLALIPVNSIYNFQKLVNENFQEEINKEEYKGITYSQGIFITHYKAPLGEIIRVSKDELERVKEIFKDKRNDLDMEKDASILSIMTEGYDNRSVYFKNHIEGELSVDFIWSTLMRYFNKENSTYFHNQLQIEFLPIIKNIEKYEEYDVLSMFEAEQIRLMKRSIINKEESSELINNINYKLKEFLIINRKDEDTLDFNNYFDLFNVIRGLKQNMMEG